MALYKRGIVNGRYYEYLIADPTESEINSEAQNLYEEAKAKAVEQARANGGRPDDVKATFDAHRGELIEGLKKEARSSFIRKAAAKKEEELGIVREKHAQLDQAAHAEPGISELKFREVKVTDADSEGAVSKDTTPKDAKGKADRTVMEEDRYREAPTRLVDELIKERKSAQHKRMEKGGAAAKAYVDSSIPTPDTTKPVLEQFDDIAIFLSGAGRSDSQYSQFVSKFDRFHRLLVPGNRELAGYTFITRPHCNLLQSNIINDRNFAAMLNTRKDSITSAIRMMLDPVLASRFGEDTAELSVYCNYRSPFLVLLFNALRSCSGWPDLTVGTETTEGGFFSEQQTLAIGQDRGAHGGELTLQFRDIEGGPVMALHDYWARYIGNVMDGTFTQYAKDIDRNLAAYTVSIYRIIVDYTGRRITRWAKATGCFPKLNPSGNVFNQNEGEIVLNSVKDFSIQYQVNHFGYNDPAILQDFNRLIGRYNNQSWMDPDTGLLKGNPDQMDFRPIVSNFGGIPYISQIHGYNELAWRYNDGDSEIDTVKA